MTMVCAEGGSDWLINNDSDSDSDNDNDINIDVLFLHFSLHSVRHLGYQ
jgi:hypothetical protein